MKRLSVLFSGPNRQRFYIRDDMAIKVSISNHDLRSVKVSAKIKVRMHCLLGNILRNIIVLNPNAFLAN